MNMNENDIEKLLHKHFADGQATPPEGAWETIADRLQQNPAPKKRSVKKAWIIAGCLTLAAVLGSALLYHLLPNKNAESIAQLPENSMVAPSPASKGEAESIQEAENPIVAQQHPAPQKLSDIQPTASPECPADDAAAQETAEPKPTAKNSVPAPETTEQVAIVQKVVPPAANEKSAPKSEKVNVETSEPEENEIEKPTTKVEIFIPNYITPNFDGINDCWIISGAENYQDVHVRIFNPKSQCVYENQHYKDQFCGENLPAGNYFFVLTIQSHQYVRRGTLVIKR